MSGRSSPAGPPPHGGRRSRSFVADRAANSFVVVDAPGVRAAGDGRIHFSNATSPVPVRVDARVGWRVDGRRSVSFVHRPGERGAFRATSVLGEDEEHIPYEDCVFSCTVVTNHVSAPKIRATVSEEKIVRLYALPETNTEVSVSSAVEVVTNGVHVIVTTWHPCPICGATHNPQVVKEYIDTYPTSYGWRAAGAGVVVPASVWAGPMAKGVGQRISFRVVGSNDCSRCVCSAATNSVVDVHELSVSRPDYLGLDRTDAGRASPVVNVAAALVDPAADGTSYSWSDCGICSFTGRTDTAEASYFAPSNDTASAAFLAEPLTVSATVSDGSGHSDSATCTTNFTVVKVDVTIGGVGEDKEETEGAFIPYVADAADGRWTEEGTNALVAVSITCEPRDLPDGEVVTITTPEKSLYVKRSGKYYEMPVEFDFPARILAGQEFALHGHTVSGTCRDEIIQIEHPDSGAKDMAKYTCIKLNLKEVTFGGAKYHLVTKDDGSMNYTAPHWQDNSFPLDGDASDAGDRAYPVCFTRNSKMKVSAKWIVEPSELPWAITVKGDGPNGLDFPETAVMKNGNQLTIVDLECDIPFANKVDFFDPMLIDWSISISMNGLKTWLDGGTCSNQTYITLGDPLTTVYHTLAHIGCRNAQGEVSAQNCTAKIWDEFTDRDVRRVDGVQLTYYASYNCANVDTATLLLHGDGQCGAWASLFIDLRKVQGIDDKNEYVVFYPIAPPGIPQNYVGFLVKNWTFSGVGLSGYPQYPYLNILDSGFIGLTEYRWKYAEVNDAVGIPGQGNHNPASLFNNHQVVIEGKYYDPSYGVQYSSLEELEAQSIDGFYIGPFQLPIDEPMVNCDLNDDGDKIDLKVIVNVLLIKSNQPGLEIREVRYDR